MAGNNDIGSGAVVLTASADPLVNGLNQAEAKVKNWGKSTQKSLASADLGQGLAKGMKFGEVMELGLAGGVAALGRTIANAFLTGPLELFNAELERSQDLVNKLEKALNKSQSEFLKRVDALGGPGSVAGGKMLRERIDSAEQATTGKQDELTAARNSLNDILKNRSEMFGRNGQLVKLLPFQEEQRETELKTAQQRLKDAESSLANHTARIEKLKEKLNEPVQLGPFAKMSQTVFDKAQESAKALQNDVDTLTAKYKAQAETFGMTAAQSELYSLKQRGATDEMLRQAEARAQHMQDLTNIMADNGPKLAGAIEAGSTEAFAASLQVRGFDVGDANEVHRDNGKKLEKIAESNARFEKLMEELNEKWEGGGF